jgi:Tol biopolymer transport system component
MRHHGGYGFARISPDVLRAAICLGSPTFSTWIWGFATERLTRITSGPASDCCPTWTPDGRRLIPRVTPTTPGGGFNLFERSADGTGEITRLTTSPESGNRVGLTRRPRVVLVRTPFDEPNAAVSPEGRWIAYDSNESGRYEARRRAGRARVY